MKATKILVMLLALVLVFALVACGGEKEPEVTDDATVTTTAAATTTKAAATTTKAATTTAAPAVTTAAPVVTTTAAPVIPETPFDYNALYVGYKGMDGDEYLFENTSLILEFYSATPETQFVTGANYADETKTAANRFAAKPDTYTPFTVFSTAEADKYYVTGGTATITSPWSFMNYYGRDYWIFDGGQKTGGASAATHDGELLEVKDITDYYVTDAKTWTKTNYASSFCDGYFHMGMNSFLTFAEAVKAAKNAGDGSYTIQFVAARTGAKGSWDTFIGENRVTISESKAGETKINSKMTPDVFVACDIDDINSYTFTYGSDSGVYDLKIFVNNYFAASFEDQAPINAVGSKIFESADANIYAIRVYNYVLSEEEVAQNHFADLASICKLDITEFLKLDDAAKASVYTALAEYTYDIPQMLIQKALNDAIAAAK